MNPMTNGTHALSAVTRVLILGYYDGATNGVLQFGQEGPVYRFDWIDEARNADGYDVRTYELRPLPGDALEQLVAILKPYHQADWPMWCPLWTFPSEEARLAVEQAFDKILDAAGPASNTLITTDINQFQTFTLTPSRIATK